MRRTKKPDTVQSDDRLKKRAEELAQQYVIAAPAYRFTSLSRSAGILSRVCDMPHLQQLNLKSTPLPFTKVIDFVIPADHTINILSIDQACLNLTLTVRRIPLSESPKDVSMFPSVICKLLAKGYTDKYIEKICGRNLRRVLQQVLNASKG